ncbi:MAG TPA: glycoside hydrolase family 78 protein [Anaerolineales bacterium]|nr:glycoside hydrolase family 78 protein [Anaerolineales bacterium]
MALTVSNLTCEYRINPLGIDVLQPRLSWQLESDRRGARQTAYRILTAASEASLTEGSLLWDSGKVSSDQSIHITYQGPGLVSGQRVYWKVSVSDEAGREAQSRSAWWEMGLLERTDWQGQWIGAFFSGGPRTTSPAPYVRKEFRITKQVVSARLYATALGLYESYLNGVRVGDALLTPGWTDYNKRIQYQVYDVTPLIQAGPNAWGAILGDGWSVGHIAWVGRQRYTDRPQLLAQIILTYSDGNQEIIATDESWKVTQGPVLESDMLMGESYDARRELTGWCNPGYDDSAWWSPEVFEDRGAALVATNGPAVKRQEELRPVKLWEIPDFVNPRWIFDLGQNMVGWVRLRVCGDKGTTVSIRSAEVLNPDGTLYTANLRTARNTDYYTLKGDGEEIWEPRFLFHGFRYVELLGYPGIPTEETVTGIVIHSDTPLTGTFECSDPLINQLQHNIVWGQKGNFVDVPTDCPQRDERLGWTGDAQVFVRTAAYNMNVAGFFTKWTRDLEDAQLSDGAYPAVAPNPSAWSIGDGGPAWADAGVICPWTIYQCYGDTRLLASRYASMQRFVEFLSQSSRDGLRCYAEYTGWHGFGDWLALDGSDGREGGTSKELIGTAFFAYSSRLLAEIAQILGKEEDSKRYEDFHRQAREAFVKHFVRSDGTLTGGTQTSYVLGLHFDLLPAELRSIAVAELVRNIEQRDNHLSTGFVGTPYLNWVLSDTGHFDIAYALLKQTTWPSWLYSVTQGATTIWERWDGWTHDKGFQDQTMNSFNHYAYGAVGAWMYAVVGGIELDPEQPGYKNIIMRPRPGGGLTSAKATLRSMYGFIRSEWTLENTNFDWQITVPVNTTATVYMPAGDLSHVTENGGPVEEKAQGITFLRVENGFAVFEVKAGQYSFSSQLDHPA